MRSLDRGAMLIGAVGAAAGALAAHLLDPVRGRGRRARYVDQGMGMLRRGARVTARAGRVAVAEAEGKLQAMRAGTGGQADLNDAALGEKVETELFRDPSIPKGSININAEDGVVVMRGEVGEEGQRRSLEEKASRIPGVRSVENRLRLAGEAVQHGGGEQTKEGG